MRIDSGIKQHGAIRFRIHVTDNFTYKFFFLILQSMYEVIEQHNNPCFIRFQY